MKSDLSLLAGIGTLACSLTAAVAGSPPNPGAWRGRSLTEFTSEKNESLGWQVVNDGVMGGLSNGEVDLSNEGVMRFSGVLSLDNNGGFSTVRSGAVDFDLSNDLGLLLRVKGDGRTYEAQVESSARFRGRPVSFAGKFSTTEGEWVQVKIPFSSFTGSFHGRELPETELDPSVIRRIGILLADKQAGDFDLRVDWIRTYGKGQGATLIENKTSTASAPMPKTSGTKNLIETAVEDGRFTILKKALDTAGLTVFFQWDNPLTVFAPTDAAFAKLPEGTLEELIKPENKERLIAILSYHVAPGSHPLADSLASGEINPVKGGKLSISLSDGKVRINGVALLDADISCSDGMIHVIDSVLLPPAPEISDSTDGD